MAQIVRAFAEDDDFDEDHPDNVLPLKHRRAARWLARLGANFEDYYWPACWTLASRSDITRPNQPTSHGWDLTFCIDIEKWTVGFEFPSEDEPSSRYETWKDIILHVGPCMLVLHRWWYRNRG